MPNMENFFLYEDYQYQLVSHILVFGFGAMVAGLVYFAITASSIHPRYRISNYLGCVVMVSAGLILYTQYNSWTKSFRLARVGSSAVWYHPALGVDADGVPLMPPSDPSLSPEEIIAKRSNAGTEAALASSGSVFSNGYRYMNWTIDVPTLQIQLLAVVGLAGASFLRNAIKFTVGGLAMIYTSYVAQFYEPAFAPGADWAYGQTMFWVFYGLGWLAYVYILYAVYTGVFKQISHMHPRAQNVMKGIWRLFLVSWTVYAIAIAMPAIAYNTHGAVWRQFLFTFADVVSKVIFGAMIGRVATYQSAAEGYLPAIESCDWDPSGKVSGIDDDPEVGPRDERSEPHSQTSGDRSEPRRSGVPR